MEDGGENKREQERTGTEKLKDVVAALMLDNGAMSVMATGNAYSEGLNGRPE
jgi:hypothetical protein